MLNGIFGGWAFFVTSEAATTVLQMHSLFSQMIFYYLDFCKLDCLVAPFFAVFWSRRTERFVRNGALKK